MDNGWARRTFFNDSRTVRGVDYDPKTRRMRVFFVRNDAVWDYYDIAPSEYASLVAATSPGAVFNERIRDRYEAVQVLVEQREGKRVAPTKQRRGQIVMLDNYEGK